MVTLTLPFLTSSLTSPERAGRLRFGWSATQVSIKEAQPSDFRLAVCEILTYTHCQSFYEHAGTFWGSAMGHVRPLIYNSIGMRAEAPFSTSEKSDIAELRLLSEPLNSRLKVRAKNYGGGITLDGWENIKTKESLYPGDGHEEDLLQFVDWCADNLRMVDGRLMKRVHAPSIVLSWSTDSRKLRGACSPFRFAEYMRTYGKHRFHNGLHFRIGDEAIEEVWREMSETFGPGILMSAGYTNAKAISMAVAEMKAKGLGKMTAIQDMAIFDPAVLEDIDEDKGDDMAERSALLVAEAIVADKARHLPGEGPGRDAFEALKQLVSIIPEFRPADFHEQLGKSLTLLSPEGLAARDWVVGKAIDMWTDREISLRPNGTFGM
jgi:hypothetical protein